MKDLTHSIVFKNNDKVIWSLRCDKDTFDLIEFHINRILINGVK